MFFARSCLFCSLFYIYFLASSLAQNINQAEANSWESVISKFLESRPRCFMRYEVKGFSIDLNSLKSEGITYSGPDTSGSYHFYIDIIVDPPRLRIDTIAIQPSDTQMSYDPKQEVTLPSTIAFNGTRFLYLLPINKYAGITSTFHAIQNIPSNLIQFPFLQRMNNASIVNFLTKANTKIKFLKDGETLAPVAELALKDALQLCFAKNGDMLLPIGIATGYPTTNIVCKNYDPETHIYRRLEFTVLLKGKTVPIAISQCALSLISVKPLGETDHSVQVEIPAGYLIDDQTK